METKEQLVTFIKKWVKMDNDIRALQAEITRRKKEIKQTSADLIDVMRKNEIDCFDINDGKIMYVRKSVKKPINQKLLLDVLEQYFEGDTLRASELKNTIMDSREETIRENIVRKIDKS
jgi:hypothetical protein